MSNKQSHYYIGFAIFCGLLISLPSCKKDSDSSTTPTIVGKWEAREIHYHLYDTSTNPPTQVYHIDTAYAAGKGDYIEFRDNSTFIERSNATSASLIDSGTYALSNNNTTIVIHGMMSGTSTGGITLSASTFTTTKDTITGNQHLTLSETYNKL